MSYKQHFTERNKLLRKSFILLFLLISSIVSAQQAIVKGAVKDSLQAGIPDVTITYLNTGTTTNSKGEYQINVWTDSIITLTFRHVSYNTYVHKLRITPGATVLLSPVLVGKTKLLDEVIVEDKTDELSGLTQLNPATTTIVPGISPGVENVLLTLAGVNNSNELSTQYNVRGGNFDENLVYVNGIEVYRPFLIRSGQQEGLSFVNSNMVQSIRFSAGGFQAKYGDKNSSVLDIQYRTPENFGMQVNASLLGGSLTVEDLKLNGKLSAIFGARYRNTNMIVDKKDIASQIRPEFIDIQTFITYLFSPKLKFDFLGNNFEGHTS